MTAGPYDKPISKIYMESTYGAVIWSREELAGPPGVEACRAGLVHPCFFVFEISKHG